MEENESVGRYLKREREVRNISLREVAKNTKVKEHLLKAIEEGQYVSLPSSTYIKGFLLSYARYLGLDSNDVLLRYESSLKGKSVSRPEAVPSEKKVPRNRRYLWMIGGIIAVSLCSSYFLFLHPSKPPMVEPAVKPKVEEPLSSPPPMAVTTPAPEEQSFSLQLKAVADTWVRLQINGQPHQEMLLRPGESTSHQAQKRIALLVGNAGGLDIIFNGKALERFGKPGEVVDLVITAQGVQKQPREKTESKPE